jgi:hypothetical protein
MAIERFSFPGRAQTLRDSIRLYLRLDVYFRLARQQEKHGDKLQDTVHGFVILDVRHTAATQALLSVTPLDCSNAESSSRVLQSFKLISRTK